MQYEHKLAIAEAMLRTLVGLGWPSPTDQRYKICNICSSKNEFGSDKCIICNSFDNLYVVSTYNSALVDLYIALENGNKVKLLYEKTPERSTNPREK